MKTKKIFNRRRCFEICMGMAIFFVVSCDDMEDKMKPAIENIKSEPSKLYILSEGLFNSNNSSLAKYDFTTKSFTYDFFLAENQRGLGDTGNDMGIYGSKLYIVVNVSSQLRLGCKNGQIMAKFSSSPIMALPGTSKFNFYKNKAYICSFDGTVAKLIPVL
jgi:hypothetical protein